MRRHLKYICSTVNHRIYRKHKPWKVFAVPAQIKAGPPRRENRRARHWHEQTDFQNGNLALDGELINDGVVIYLARLEHHQRQAEFI
jgi:hypothetical protein